MEPVNKDLPAGSYTQAANRDITEEPASVQVIEASSDTLIPSNGEGFHQLGRIHQVIQTNIFQNLNKINLDAEILDSPRVKYHNVPS